MPTLDIAHLVLNHWTNKFLGGVVLHGMLVSIFYVNVDINQEVLISEDQALNHVE